ncbi:MAG: glutamate--tRNA ligase [Anaerolineales bacterium]|nr:glutamate--tRNA ligase [Anaerolineales bacterium]
MKIRLRFAPSPTGPLHIGGARTALFNWLYARHCGGSFILRIEDTDQNRYVTESLDDIISGLRWLGIDWDEGPQKGGEYGPYFQSERTGLYQKWGNWLVENGFAYKCWCTAERLQARRQDQHRHGAHSGYDRHCRFLTADQIAGKESSGEPYIIRFKIPEEGSTTIHDMIRGPITFQHEQLEDLVLLKSDGYPTYHLANVVDDHFMEISHIVRADEWIPTAPLHALMYDAFDWEKPIYAHAPLILNPSGKGKLSKRTQAFSDAGQEILVQLREFKNAGYLPEAVVNFLTNVGWAFGDDREVFTPEEAIVRFELKDINPAPARLPYSKLEWLNGVYIREMEIETLAAKVQPFLQEAGYPADMDTLRQAIPLVQERLKTLHDVVPWLSFVFTDILSYDPSDLIAKKMDAVSTLAALRLTRELLNGLQDFEENVLEEHLRWLVGELNLKAGQLFGIIRTATSGQKVAPPLFGTLAVLGKDKTLARIDRAIQMLLVLTG